MPVSGIYCPIRRCILLIRLSAMFGRFWKEDMNLFPDRFCIFAEWN
jgi:hypothetical protein